MTRQKVRAIKFQMLRLTVVMHVIGVIPAKLNIPQAVQVTTTCKARRAQLRRPEATAAARLFVIRAIPSHYLDVTRLS